MQLHKLYLIICFFCFHVVAADNLDTFAKEQQRNDSNVLRENKLTKKNVFSNKRELLINNIQIPHDKVCYKIDKFIFSNDFIHDRNISAIKNKFSGHCIGISAIRILAKIIQDYFINVGFVTTRVDIPNQDLTTGQLILTIVPGRIEHIIIEGKDVNSNLCPINEGEGQNLRDIDQGLEN